MNETILNFVAFFSGCLFILILKETGLLAKFEKYAYKQPSISIDLLHRLDDILDEFRRFELSIKETKIRIVELFNNKNGVPTMENPPPPPINWDTKENNRFKNAIFNQNKMKDV
jgi:hypothetical protein